MEYNLLQKAAAGVLKASQLAAKDWFITHTGVLNFSQWAVKDLLITPATQMPAQTPSEPRLRRWDRFVPGLAFERNEKLGKSRWGPVCLEPNISIHIYSYTDLGVQESKWSRPAALAVLLHDLCLSVCFCPALVQYLYLATEQAGTYLQSLFLPNSPPLCPPPNPCIGFKQQKQLMMCCSSKYPHFIPGKYFTISKYFFASN